MEKYNFTSSWFYGAAQKNWESLIPRVISPTKILEIGSYEGASACYLIDKLGSIQQIEIHCIDTWEGGIEHKSGGTAEANMQTVKSVFLENTRYPIERSGYRPDLRIHKGKSDTCLSHLLSQGKHGYFDFIYIDGSHQAPDVLCDAVLSFRLLRTGGIMVFDGYLWHEELSTGRDILRSPKPAIDAFTNIYCKMINIIPMPLYQLYI